MPRTFFSPWYKVICSYIDQDLSPPAKPIQTSFTFDYVVFAAYGYTQVYPVYSVVQKWKKDLGKLYLE